MWNIAGLPMLISKWSPILEETQPEIKTMSLWVTLKNVPHSMYSWDGLSFLSSPIGNPIRLHQETELCNNFEEAKVFVEVNLKQELPKNFRFKLPGEVDATVEFSYPWLPPKCSRCCKWGHLTDVCVMKQASPTKSTPMMLNDTVAPIAEIEEGEIVSVDTETQKQRHGTVEATRDENQTTDIGETLNLKAPESEEEEWSKVSPGKGCRSNGKNNNNLTYGEVSILSATRFSALNDENNMEEEQMLANPDQLEAGIIETASGHEVTDSGDKKEEMVSERTFPLRTALPRSSKASNKALETLTQKTRAAPGTSSKRNSKKHH